MFKRKIIDLENITLPLWERCRIPSVFIIYSELQGFRTVVAPIGKCQRPVINLEQRNSIKRNSVKINPKIPSENLEFNDYDKV